MIVNDAVYQTQYDLDYVEESIKEEERYSVDGFLPASDVNKNRL